VLIRISEGQPWARIARDLGISLGGVGSANKQILKKLGATSAAHAVRLAYRDGLLGDPPAVELPPSLVQVLELVADGRTNQEIACTLGRSKHTVITQVADARRRLGARDRAHAAVLAVEARLIRRPNRTGRAA
jgi:DNA-binding NarL/FixJ family response regulator